MLGLKWRCLAAIPLPPKKTIEEHAATQAEFLETKLDRWTRCWKQRAPGKARCFSWTRPIS